MSQAAIKHFIITYEVTSMYTNMKFNDPFSSVREACVLINSNQTFLISHQMRQRYYLDVFQKTLTLNLTNNTSSKPLVQAWVQFKVQKFVILNHTPYCNFVMQAKFFSTEDTGTMTLLKSIAPYRKQRIFFTLAIIVTNISNLRLKSHHL